MSGLLTIKQYTPTYYRVNHLRRHLQVHIQKPQFSHEPEAGSSAGTPADVQPTEQEQETATRQKPRTSYARAKTAVFEYAICNDWQYFCTLTPNGKNADYYSVDHFMKRVAQWVRNMRRNPGWENFKYITVPEKFPNGDGYHLHGLMSGIPDGGVVPFVLDEAKNKRQRKKFQKFLRKGYLNFPAFTRSFGYTTMSPVKSKERIAGYICKYIVKDLAGRAAESGVSLYYPCRGLKRAETVFKQECHLSLAQLYSDFPNNRAAYFDYWNHMNSVHALTWGNDYGVYGTIHHFDFEVNPTNGEVCKLKIYTSEGDLEPTVFDICAFVQYAYYNGFWEPVYDFFPIPVADVISQHPHPFSLVNEVTPFDECTSNNIKVGNNYEATQISFFETCKSEIARAAVCS